MSERKRWHANGSGRIPALMGPGTLARHVLLELETFVGVINGVQLNLARRIT